MGLAYEFFLLLAVVLAFYFIFSVVTGWTDATDPAHRLASQLGLFFFLGVYFVWCWSGGRATLPMQTLQMTLVDARTHQPLSYQRALARYLLAWPSNLSLLGILWCWVDADRQSLHDRLAGCRLVVTPGVRQPTSR